MFGQQDDQSNQQQDTHHIPDHAIDTELSDDQPAAVIMPATEDSKLQSEDSPTLLLAPTTDQDWQHPGTPLEASKSTAPLATPDVSEASDTTLANDLIDIKQQALGQLSPLVGHLDQSPEEKFRTTMMMIQASDDQSMIKSAFEAAKAISDEKTRAQALLDIVNEINYFTHATPE